MKHQQKFDWFSCWLISLAPLANTRIEGFCFFKECFITIDWPFKCWIIFVIFWFPLKLFFRMFNSLKCKNTKLPHAIWEGGGRGKSTTLTKSPTSYFSSWRGGGGLLVWKKFEFLFYFYKKYYIFLLLLIRVRKFYF
jgi:hypothetical protein